VKPLAPALRLAFALALGSSSVALAADSPPADAIAAKNDKAKRASAAADSSQLLAGAIDVSTGITTTVAPWMRAAVRLPGSSAGNLRFSPPRIDEAPAIDGVLDDAVWAQAAALDSFTHGRPVEGVRDSLGTVALVAYDDKNLYVAFHAKDAPDKVQAPVVPRDQVGQGDWVGVSIDTYNDQQRSFFLCANPLGIQMDGVDQEGRDSDMAPDFQYTSKGRVTADGYEVEMAIPFTTLRFQPGEQVTFGFQAIRDIKRDGTHMYWAPISRNVNSYHSQLGSLQGLTNVRPGRNLQLNPTHTTTTLGLRGADGMSYEDPRGRFGLGAKVGITSNLIADVAMTPDFSQVEADAGVVDINERFAIFFAEKRPFFLEGSDIFNSPIQLVYTRRIVDPLYGGKLTGKVGRTSIGILNAADRSAGAGLDGLPNHVNPYLDREAIYSIARFKQDVFKNSYVGLTLGDRTQSDQFNRGLSVDGRLRWMDKYSFTFQGAHSWARDKNFTTALDVLTPEDRANVPGSIAAQKGRSFEGNTYFAELARDTRPLNLGANVFGYSPEFAADMGFIRRTNLLGVSGWVRPHVWGKEKQWFTGIHFPMYYERDYTYDGETKTDEVVSLVQEVVFPKQSWIGMEHVYRYIRHNGVEFDDIYRHAIWAGSERFRTLRAGGLYVWGEQVVFGETLRGRDERWELWADFRFGSQFDGGLFLRGSTVWRGDKDSRFANVFIPRLRMSYQFNKELSLRVITELVDRKSYDVSDDLVGRTQNLVPDVLMSYYVRPGTVVYLGYGSVLDGQETDDLRPAQNSLFTKVSYLWQL
jgi:hypothetical protein